MFSILAVEIEYWNLTSKGSLRNTSLLVSSVRSQSGEVFPLFMVDDTLIKSAWENSAKASVECKQMKSCIMHGEIFISWPYHILHFKARFKGFPTQNNSLTQVIDVRGQVCPLELELPIYITKIRHAVKRPLLIQSKLCAVRLTMTLGVWGKY